MSWESAMAYSLRICLGLITFMVIGCAASPDTFIYVDKSIYITEVHTVEFDYESNAAVDSEARLEGTVSPTTEVKLK